LDHPFGGRLRADARNPEQVVAALADERGQIAVAPGRYTIFGFDGGRIHAGDLGDAPLRVEQGDVFADQLHGVAVAAGDDHLHARLGGLPGHGGDDVVGLVALHLHMLDAQRVEHLLGEAHLPLERRRGLTAAGLVFLVLLAAERHPGHIEGHRDVGRFLVAQHVDQH
jgi:hypothetical protein